MRRRLKSAQNGAGETTKYGYDLDNNRTGITKPKLNSQAFEYDAANRLTGITTPAGSSDLVYDLNGNLKIRRDANGHETKYDYDARNRRTQTTFADLASETRTYDGADNLATLTDANGARTTYGYDARNRETSKTYSASADGLLSIATGYDGNNNVTSTTELYAGEPARAHQRGYDEFDRLQSETDPWGGAVTRTYDAQGNLKSMAAAGSTTRYEPDVLNRRASTTAAGGPIAFGYDRTDLPTTVAYPNGVVSETTYDPAMRVKTITHRKGATVLESTTYEYDANGNRSQQVRLAGNVTETTTYGYDEDDWLRHTQVTTTDGTTTSTQSIDYTLDAAGNRTAETSTATGPDAAALTYAKTYSLDPRDQVTQVAVTGGSAPGTTTYTYDADGNLRTKTGPTANRTFIWNVGDRLVEVQDAGATVARYRYNAEGLRDEVVGERRTTWVNGFAYLDKAPDNSFLAKYETHPNGRSPVVALTPGGAEYEQIDALGSTTLSTNSAGGTSATTTYDAFGNSITTGSTANKFGYTGHETDRSTGLVYFKARHYEPELGRFISADPFEGEPTYPVTWNDYLYANGNPLTFVDKAGYQAAAAGGAALETGAAVTTAGEFGAAGGADALDLNGERRRPGIKLNDTRLLIEAFKRSYNALKDAAEAARRKFSGGEKMVGEDQAKPGVTIHPSPATPPPKPIPPSTRPEERPGDSILVTPDEREKFNAYDQPLPPILTPERVEDGRLVTPIPEEDNSRGITTKESTEEVQRWEGEGGRTGNEMTPSEIKSAREKGRRAARAQERELIQSGHEGTVEGGWTWEERKRIAEKGQYPDDVRWHHINDVNRHPELAEKPENIVPSRGGAAGHVRRYHPHGTRGGSSGEMLDREKLIEQQWGKK